MKENAFFKSLKTWGSDFFQINTTGQLCISPDSETHTQVPLHEITEALKNRHCHPPVLLHFPQLITQRVNSIRSAFETAQNTHQYPADYRLCFPIKVNQQAHVIETYLNAGEPHGYGLEAGSKPELLAVLGMSVGKNTPILCNGFKDMPYIETAMLARRLGRQIIVIIEKPSEVRLIIQSAQKYNVSPLIGLRVKLATRGAGRWDPSSGPNSKFGLRIDQLLTAVNQLKTAGLHTAVCLLHCHIGSQITRLAAVKDMTREMARLYCALKPELPNMDTLDLGGGLSVPYTTITPCTHQQTTQPEDAPDYTLQDYADTIITNMYQITDEAKVPAPRIITESGRAITAHHAMLIVNVLGHTDEDTIHQTMDDQPMDSSVIETLSCSIFKESWDELQKGELDDEQTLTAVKRLWSLAQTAFLDGNISLAQRVNIERFYRQKLKLLHQSTALNQYAQASIDAELAGICFANFSVFQSVPDSWALGHCFPVLPIHRLDEKPTQHVTLGDITCDSDGQINHFPEPNGTGPTLMLHTINNQPYYLGIFLLGAYQQALGSEHNLFGKTHAANIMIKASGHWEIESIQHGATVDRMLQGTAHVMKSLVRRLNAELDQARLCGEITPEQAERMLAFYQQSLASYVYLADKHDDSIA